MSKPDDIPHGVWRTAQASALSGLATVAFDTIKQNDAALYALTNVIARAIIAATVEERALCAMTVSLLSSDDLGDEFFGRAAHFGDGLELAEAAIRKRGQP